MEAKQAQKRSSGLPPDPQLYEREYEFWPWGRLIKFVVEWIEKNAASNANILDYMCGTGLLLNELANRCPGFFCYGCSLTPEYISYAKQVYPSIGVNLCDARDYRPPKDPDIVVCTAGIHHLPWDSQHAFVEKVANEISTGKTFILGEELIRDCKDEKVRRLSVIEMISAIMNYMIERDAPSEIMANAADVLKADIAGREYKIDMATTLEMLKPYFDIKETHHVWPDTETGYGDYVFVCRRR